MDKYLDLARELKRSRNMKMMVIPIIDDTLGTVLKGFEKRMAELVTRGRTETIECAALLKLERILKRIKASYGDLL